MTETASYTITLTTDFAEWARYNLFMMCSCKNADGENVDFAHLISKGNANGNSIAPSADARRKLQLTTAPCDSFELYIYIVANTLPASRIIGQCPPFEAMVTITADGREIYAKPHAVNQWGGATIYVEFPRK